MHITILTNCGVVFFMFFCHDRSPHHLGSTLNVRVYFFTYLIFYELKNCKTYQALRKY